MNPRIEEIKGKLQNRYLHIPNDDDALAESFDDIAFLLAEVERLEGELTHLKENKI